MNVRQMIPILPHAAGVVMTQKNFAFIAGLLFLLVALTHLWRIIEGWDVVVYGNIMPMWASWVALVVTGILSFYGFRYGMDHRRPAQHHRNPAHHHRA